jgi:hypothetical protein
VGAFSFFLFNPIRSTTASLGYLWGVHQSLVVFDDFGGFGVCLWFFGGVGGFGGF